MPVAYAVCPTCSEMIVPPTAYQARLDGAATLHARITGHSVHVYDDSDPDERLYTVAGEPSLLTEL